MDVVDDSRLSSRSNEPSVHEGSHCHCLAAIDDKYRQVLDSQSEFYADVPDFLRAVESCSYLVVREFYVCLVCMLIS